MGYQKAAVVFIDILGTRENRNFDDKYFIHKLFHGEARNNENRKHDHVIYDRKVYSFSDCAYFIYYYKEGVDVSAHNDLSLFKTAIYNTSLSILRFMNAGYMIRGGATFGEVYFDDLGCFGPALEEAYELESKYALYPRLLINKEMGKKITSTESAEIFKHIFTDMPQLCEVDENGDYFLNVFYSLETTGKLLIEGEAITLDGVKSVMSKVAENNMSRYKDSDQTSASTSSKVSIFEKNKWLREYLDTKKVLLNPQISSGAVTAIVTGD